jgi:HAD superfamily hydrolase (TIGR01450 family)
MFLTNDARSSRDELVAELVRIGVETDRDHVLSAGSVLAEVLAEQAAGQDGTAFVIGAESLRAEVREAGLEVLAGDAGAAASLVGVAAHDNFAYDELRVAMTAVRAGAPLYVTCRDPTYPTGGGLWPGTGAVIAAVEVASGATAVEVGKPDPRMFEAARRHLAGAARLAMVGDSLATDISGANRLGLETICVLTGKTSAAEAEAATGDESPDEVAESLAELAELK